MRIDAPHPAEGRHSEAGKADVRRFWEAGACGEVYADGPSERERFEAQRKMRYELEPFIQSFARFAEGAHADVLEIGVGMGADHLEWAAAGPRRLVGLDLTERAVETTRRRAKVFGTQSALLVGDAEHLSLPDDRFDIVYGWGVLHHSPDTQQALREVRRVLRPGGVARIMVYHRVSVVGALLWLRYALVRGRPRTRLDDIYAQHLESPGTKAYSRQQAETLLRAADFHDIRTSIELSAGDLLTGAAGQSHEDRVLRLARRFWPRRLIARFGRRFGLFLLIEAR